VVDKHHHVLKPIWDAKKRGDLPNSGVKMIHFDSHPDMATFGSNIDPEKEADIKLSHKLAPQIYNDHFDQLEVLRLSDISDWVFTPVLQGMCDEVVWISGWWCSQLDKNDSHDMFVGIDPKDHKIKIGIKGDKGLNRSFLEYWSTSGYLAKEKELTHVRHFKMHVVHFKKDCKLPTEWRDKIVKMCKNKPWILDIDEDYLSTQNPFSVEFEAMFGESIWEPFGDLYDEVADEDAEDAIVKMAAKDVFLKNKNSFENDPLTKAAINTLHKNCKHVSKQRAKTIVHKIGPILKKLYPKAGPPPQALDADSSEESGSENEEDYLSVRAHYDCDELLQAAAISCLPHHISTFAELTALGQNTRSLFMNIGTPPGVITIATSRSDMYTPEYQGDILNFMTIDICEDVWKNRRDVVTHRRDWRSTPLSVSEDDKDPGNCMLALMLTYGKLSSLPKVPSN